MSEISSAPAKPYWPARIGRIICGYLIACTVAIPAFLIFGSVLYGLGYQWGIPKTPFGGNGLLHEIGKIAEAIALILYFFPISLTIAAYLAAPTLVPTILIAEIFRIRNVWFYLVFASLYPFVVQYKKASVYFAGQVPSGPVYGFWPEMAHMGLVAISGILAYWAFAGRKTGLGRG